MKGKKWLILSVSLAIVLLVNRVGGTMASFVDQESSTGNAFEAWASMQWVQTTRADFEAGVLTDVDTSSSLGDIQLGSTTITLGNSANNQGDATVAQAVHTQADSFATVPYNGVITSWTYYNAGPATTGTRLEFLSGSGNTWTMMAKSDAVDLTGGIDIFTVSIPVEAGWQLGIYSGSGGKLKYNKTGGTVEGRGKNSGDFDVDVTKSDFSSSNGHLALTAVLRYHYPSGTIASQVLDTEVAGASWDALFWDETLLASTNITFEVRASDNLFAKDADPDPPSVPDWISVGGMSPVTSGLPSGRYVQWRATLTTSDTSKTPTLHEVRVYHY